MQKWFVVAVIGGCAAVMQMGCSGTKETGATTEQIATPLQEQNEDLALDHYLQGSTLDQKGEYAKAILEYQDALHYKQDPAVYHSIAKDYALIGKSDLAIQMGKEAVRLAPENRAYHETL